MGSSSQIQVLARAPGCAGLPASHGQGRAARPSCPLDDLVASPAAPAAAPAVPTHHHNAAA
eukprot:1146291-Pelagomonas_calceolata.AAC.4